MRLCAAGFTSSQRNPRYCESAVGRSIMTSSSSTSRSDSEYRKYQRTAHRIQTGSVCRHLKIAGRVPFSGSLQPTSPPAPPVATHPFTRSGCSRIACSDKKWPVRAAAVFAIAKKDDPALLNVITPALDDKNDIVRYEASAAVLRLSSGKTGSNLVGLTYRPNTSISCLIGRRQNDSCRFAAKTGKDV